MKTTHDYTFLRSLFSLAPDVTYLNHGSFGAVPIAIQEERRSILHSIERNPMHFYKEVMTEAMQKARQHVALYLGAKPEHIAFVRNSSHGVQVAINSIPLDVGDEVLTTSLEYGACLYAWRHRCRLAGATLREVEIPIPLPTSEEIEDLIIKSVTASTKVIFVSHITSSTATLITLERLCAFARQHGIVTVVDGSHAPSQIPLRLDTLQADWYTGNHHKWLCSARSSAFLYCNPTFHTSVIPPVISWGWDEAGGTAHFGSENTLIERLLWQGTDDMSQYLSTPQAIAFQEKYNWNEVVASCTAMLHTIFPEFLELPGITSMYAGGTPQCPQMATFVVANSCNIAQLQRHLAYKERIEVVLQATAKFSFLRISAQGYNAPEDYQRLLHAWKDYANMS